MNTEELFFVEQCLTCGANTEQATTTLEFNYSFPDVALHVSIRVHDVPVARCTSCGEEYVPGELAVYISEYVERAANLHKELVAENRRHTAPRGVGHLEPTSLDIGWSSMVPA